MNGDMTYCNRGMDGQCPRDKDCARVIEPELLDHLSWVFGGCSETESGELDYYYFKPKTEMP